MTYQDTIKDKLWRLENSSVVRPKTEDLTYLSPFTWSEVAGRPYTVDELVAIGKEELDPADIGKVTTVELNPALNGNGLEQTNPVKN